MKTGVKRLLKEALFRYLAFHDGEPLTEAWTGLGYKSEYKPAIEAGLMEWVDGEPEKRIASWLRLTESGAKIVQKCLDDGYTYEDAMEGVWPKFD